MTIRELLRNVEVEGDVTLCFFDGDPDDTEYFDIFSSEARRYYDADVRYIYPNRTYGVVFEVAKED
jgi:hypothetical protein